jgi:hypothetical protein
MRKTTVAALICLLVLGIAGSVSARQDMELGGGLVFFMPDEDDTWDNSFGADFEMRFWLNDVLGVACGLGMTRWDIDSQRETWADGEYTYWQEISGDAGFMSLGGAVVVRTPVFSGMRLTAEGGVRYVYSNSDVELEYERRNGSGFREYKAGTVDFDGTSMIGLIAADLEMPVASSVALFVGGGFQFDIVKADVEWYDDSKLDDLELQAFYVQGGARVSF